MVLVITAADRHDFKRCRRAWDLGSPMRQNWEPDDATPAVDLAEAVRAALAVWYFPGMWAWDRAIVRPLAMEAYRRVVSGWRPVREDLVDLGDRLLGRYFEWAPSVDRFTPVRVETDFQVSIPDPTDPLRDLAAADGAAVHFAGRIELLVVDRFDVYWLVDHRVGAGWADVDELVLDEAGAAHCWAWRRFFIGMDVAGVIYNELRTDIDLGASVGVPAPGHDRRRPGGVPGAVVEPVRAVPLPAALRRPQHGDRRGGRARHVLPAPSAAPGAVGPARRRDLVHREGRGAAHVPS